METKLYSVKNYNIREKDFSTYETSYDNLENVCNELKNDKSYHLRLKKGDKYIFYMDLDGYHNTIDKFKTDLKLFLNEKYNLIVEDDKIKYTKNEGKDGSYHISIPAINCTTIKQKEIITNLSKYVNIETKKCIDTTVYSDKWFRLPNQTKGQIFNKKDAIISKHIIINGKMKDFILNYIPKNSINLENIIYIENEKEKEVKEKKIIKEEKEKKKINEIIKSKTQNDTEIYNTTQIETIEKLLNILDSNYYDSFEFWRNIAFILQKYEQNTNNKMFDIFDKFSQKSKKYNSEDVKKFYDSLESYNIKFNINTLYYYARICNLEEYKKIVNEFHSKCYIEITEKYLAEKINEMAGHLFFYKKNILYCFNSKNKLWYEETPEIFKKYVNDDLYDFMKYFISDAIDDKYYYETQKIELKKLCTSNKGQENILKTFRNRNLTNTNDIEFDTKHYLVGFSNGVYDLIKNEFRSYRYNDYMTTQTGYNYKECNDEELQTIKNIIHKIENNEDNKKLLLQILATGLIGKSYQKFILLNGCGGNGKSVIARFLEQTLGEYYYAGDINVLCEKSNGNASPEVAKMDKKRYVNFSEPEATQKIKNGKMKAFTGNKTYSGRMLFSNKTEIALVCTLALECNKKIFFESEPTDGEIRRTIDYPFNSKFVEDETMVDEENRIYKADLSILNDDFLNKHKYAFLKILIDEAHKFLTIDKEQFIIPKEIQDRTNDYINKSYIYIEYLNLITEKTDNKDDYIQLTDFYNNIKTTDLYLNSSKMEKRNINSKSIIDFFESNKTTANKFKARHTKVIEKKRFDHMNVLIGYKFINNGNDINEYN